MKVRGIRRGTYGSMIWRALIVPAATVIAVPALATSAQAADVQTVTGNIASRVMDHESFPYPNTVCPFNLRLTPREIEVGTPRNVTATFKCGGEIRVEVHYTLTHQQGGFIRVTNGWVDFYEGTSVNTNDLDGRQVFSNMFLWPLQTDSRNIHVQNWTEGQPDDKADVALTLRNS
ncbi:hypothetical protein [Streptomyces sp. NPDC002491]